MVMESERGGHVAVPPGEDEEAGDVGEGAAQGGGQGGHPQHPELPHLGTAAVSKGFSEYRSTRNLFSVSFFRKNKTQKSSRCDLLFGFLFVR